MAKQRKSTSLVTRRAVRKPPSSSGLTEPTSAFLMLRNELEEAYAHGVDHQDWLVEARWFPEVALIAYRRWLREQGFDAITVNRRTAARKRRFNDAVAFKIVFDKELSAAFEQALATEFVANQFELFCNAVQTALSKFGIDVSSPQPLLEQERPLMQAIDSLPPDKTARRFRELSQRLSDETLSDAERAEFLKLAVAAESHHLKRLRAAEALSQLRGQDFFEVIDEFGLGKPSDD